MNRLFGFRQPTDAAAESTVRPFARWVRAESGKRFRIVDMPGIAASVASDRRYGPYYRRWLRRADTIVWITQANVRAYKQDQLFFREYSRYVSPGARLILALSKADTHAEAFGDQGLDGDLVRRKANDVSAEIVPFTRVNPDAVTVVPYSVARDWNVELLRSVVLTPFFRR